MNASNEVELSLSFTDLSGNNEFLIALRQLNNSSDIALYKSKNEFYYHKI